ncbi:hypothetical protein SEMRO_3666_G350090.1 [Seminavis robusta]|uniref:Uncharacterized protein n=1 Tax=Seminavis robusta TaxID=568900 RepID=A0A9N8HY57_9STRA|nr:hypothetical protein SEMRO_3666_G350090.1 [Seminavis robusta]|eukprot:Sro3666_g350090.1 n/a (92) ;mRNA; r:1499-1774
MEDYLSSSQASDRKFGSKQRDKNKKKAATKSNKKTSSSAKDNQPPKIPNQDNKNSKPPNHIPIEEQSVASSLSHNHSYSSHNSKKEYPEQP